jgi:hypothetical protein
MRLPRPTTALLSYTLPTTGAPHLESCPALLAFSGLWVHPLRILLPLRKYCDVVKGESVLSARTDMPKLRCWCHAHAEPTLTTMAQILYCSTTLPIQLAIAS